MADLKPLTDRQLAKLEAGAKPLTDPTRPGLLYTPDAKRAGRGKWLFRYSSPETGKRREMGLGAFPDVHAARARDQAETHRRSVKEGTDPLEVAKREAAAKEAARNVLTFEIAGREVWAEMRAGWKNPKGTANWLRSLEQYAFPTLGAKPVDTITPKDVADALRPIWLSKVPTAQKVRQRMDAVFSWCWAQGHIAANPCTVVDHLLPQQKTQTEHHPAMAWADVPAFVRDRLADAEPSDTQRTAILFAILTATRSNETCGAIWPEIDLDGAVWTIPPARMKMAKPHRVPLAPQAIWLLRRIRAAELHPLYVFPNARGGAGVSEKRLTEFLRALGTTDAPSTTPGRTATTHGFRSSFRDWCSDHEHPRDLAEMALAHVVKGVEGAYARSDLLARRKPLMAAWADYVCGPTLALVSDNTGEAAAG